MGKLLEEMMINIKVPPMKKKSLQKISLLPVSLKILNLEKPQMKHSMVNGRSWHYIGRVIQSTGTSTTDIYISCENRDKKLQKPQQVLLKSSVLCSDQKAMTISSVCETV